MEFIENRAPPADTYENKFCEYFLETYRDELMEILRQPNASAHYPLEVLFMQLPPNLFDKINESPENAFPIVDRAAHRAMADLYEAVEDNSGLVYKQHVHVRFLAMVEQTSTYKTVFPGSKDVGQFMGLVGTIVRTSQPKLLEYKRFYKCSKCKETMVVEAVPSRCYAFPKVDRCERLCVGAKIEQYEPGDGARNNASNYARVKDYQEVKIQEQISSRTGFGSVPKALWVILEDDLVDSCKPGDDVVITGVLFLRWKPFRKDQPIVTEVTFKANHVAVMNDQRAAVQIGPETLKKFGDFWARHKNNPFEGRNAILQSICPQVYGMYLVKLAVCVVLAGGVSKETGGSRVRGESHLLLVGDPGTGKSQILKYVSRITPRSVFTTGAGTTNAGLTVAAVKDNGEWHLEAGALVLADSGVCCIDEFSHIKEHDRTSIHEAMEQQSISIAKAGMVCKLNTKCTIVAATNPKMNHKYDPTEPLELNIGLASPLLSRFDLIIALKDAQNESWDDFLSDFILRDEDVFNYHAKEAQKSGLIWSNDTVQSYLVLIKETTPKMTRDAHVVLSRYFQIQRNSATRNAARTTVRLLESLYRLAEGHARLMYRTSVEIHDAVTAVSLIEASMQSAALAHMPNSLHIAFPENPLQEYYGQAKSILETCLGLPQLWEKEQKYLDNIILQNSQPRSANPPPPPSGAVPSQRPIPVVANTFPSSSCNMEIDSDSPNVIPETPNSNPAVNTSQLSQAAASARNIPHISTQNRNLPWISPELFSDMDCETGSPAGGIERGGNFTSTQNDNLGATSRHPISSCDNIDGFSQMDILSPIPPIEVDADDHTKTLGTVLRTPTQVHPEQVLNKDGITNNKAKTVQSSGHGGVKRKRDAAEDTTEVIKCTRTPPISSSTTSGVMSGGSSISSTSNTGNTGKSAYSILQRYERHPRTQD